MNKATLALTAAALLALFAACSKDPNAPVSAEEAAAEMKGYSQKVCDKMSACMREQLASLPAAQREMAERMMPGGDACQARFEASVAQSRQPAAGSDEPARPLTRAELEKAKACMDAMLGAACSDMMGGHMPEACAEMGMMHH
ncbi:MAG: hypothetical protein K1X75_06265 [Leptospirales bacterium]|nr:hypothetical protein [Leptospirales bacterium]